MPPTAMPSQFLSDTINALKRQVADLQRALGRPTSIMRDTSDNAVHLVDGQGAPVLAGKGQDASLTMAAGQVLVTDETGRAARPITASQFTGPLVGDSTGTHHGDVGTPTEAHVHYGDIHGNTYGFHYGPVGDGTTQNQINCLRIFHTGAYGDVGDPATFFNLYGTVHAPSERGLKAGIQDFDGAAVVDAVASPSWRWDPQVRHDDGQRHAGPMVDDIADIAPWLVRAPSDPEAARMLTDRDLIGVLWNALRATRATVTRLQHQLEGLGNQRTEATG